MINAAQQYASHENRQAADAVRHHSEKAMKLARSMRRTRQKAKTGHVICHHLRMMLAQELPATGGEKRSYGQSATTPCLQQPAPCSEASTDGQISLL